ncbi:serine hydrolase [Streptomyces sp. NPDC020965]|uniref:D-alanyl-D-alanine carboxypeptidase family protein n=1 Tax=Streptomyces sp. NPDC020965 TaxID=3365105 RepID=UPI0037BAF77A
MTHGGGTVAGESPDKSEQRKPSGGTTPGEHDPRLAMLGQPSATGVDQATATFRLPPDREREKGDDTDPAARPEPGTETGSLESDVKLRSAVAAWVASAEDTSTADGSDGSGDSDGSDESDGSGGADGSGARERPSGDAAAETAAVPEVKPGETAVLPEVKAAPDDERADADAEADVPADADAADTDPDAGTDDPHEGAGAAGAVSEEAESVADTAEGAVSVKSATPSAETAQEAKPDATEAAEAPVTESADAADGPDADAGTDSDTDADVDSRRGTDGKAETETGAGTDSEAEAEAGTGTDSETGAGAGTEGRAKPDADAPAKPPVDQPTAVLTGLRKQSQSQSQSSASPSAKAPAATSAPAVDTPTTSLKLPPAPREEATPADPATAKPAAPTPRPSTFVPLRTDGTSRPAAESAPQVVVSAPPPTDEATRQQAMPPQPPLDLLAQLTNTPDTPVRTAVRRVKIWTPLVLLLVILFAVVQLLRPLPEARLTLSADPEYTFAGGKIALPLPTEGQGAVEVEGVGSMATYGAQQAAPIASVAKVMTAYVILKEHPISGKQKGERITVDQQAEDESKKKEESTAPISKGQEFTQRQMLELLMIPSGNNAARLLARWDAGSEAEFVKKMNDAAKDLGMKDSVYTDPSGLLATTVSTPQDQIKLGKAVMKNDIFREIVDTPMIDIPGIDGGIRNNNDRALIEGGINGIKTGSSTPAGGNLLWSANTKVDGKIHRIIGVTMGVKNAKVLNDKLELAITQSIAVIKAAQSGVTSATVIKKGQVVGHVDNGFGVLTPVVATKNLKALGWPGHQVEVTIDDGGEALPGSAAAGEVVGRISVGTGPGRLTAPVALQRDLTEPAVGDKLTRIG